MVVTPLSVDEQSAWEDATSQAARIRQGEISATDAVAAAKHRIARLNPILNVVVSDLNEYLPRRLDARNRDAPLSGVPFLRKDLGIAVRGEPLYLGNAALREVDHRPKWTSELAYRFDRLGLVTLATTNTPEMGAQTTTQPLSTGPTRNPWNLKLSASGSSGGSAAAVASGMVPIAHTNDYLGSTRLPAAWNGLYGLKPGRGRVPLGSAGISRMSSECVVTRSVRDLAVVLDGISGYAPGELWTALPPPKPYIDTVQAASAGDLSRLRIGFLSHAPSAVPVDARIAAAVHGAAEALEALGHEVHQAHPEALFEDRSAAPRHDRGSDYRRRLRVIEKLLGRPVREADVEPFLWAMARRGGESVDADLAAAAWEQEWAARVTAWWEFDGFDVLLTPTATMAPEALDLLAVPATDPTRFFAEHIARHIEFTMPFNATGQPALAFPFATEDEPVLPASVQIVAAPHRDDVALAVAALLEQTNPSVRRPPINASAERLPLLRSAS